jgi:hypothetical protein
MSRHVLLKPLEIGEVRSEDELDRVVRHGDWKRFVGVRRTRELDGLRQRVRDALGCDESLPRRAVLTLLHDLWHISTEHRTPNVANVEKQLADNHNSHWKSLHSA